MQGCFFIRMKIGIYEKEVVLQLELIELEENNFHLVLKSKLADGTIGFWIVDTGASKTVFDLSRQEYYKLIEAGSHEEYQSAGISVGMIETKVGELKRVSFGSIRIKDMKVALIDLSHVNDIYMKYRDINIVGLLGSDILKAYGCVIDYRSGKIAFMRKPDSKAKK